MNRSALPAIPPQWGLSCAPMPGRGCRSPGIQRPIWDPGAATMSPSIVGMARTASGNNVGWQQPPPPSAGHRGPNTSWSPYPEAGLANTSSRVGLLTPASPMQQPLELQTVADPDKVFGYVVSGDTANCRHPIYHFDRIPHGRPTPLGLAAA